MSEFYEESIYSNRYFTCYICFICNSRLYEKPFITINMEEYENGNKYIGLGYSVKYYRKTQKIVNDGIDVLAESGYGAEFRLFDKILIWAW